MRTNARWREDVITCEVHVRALADGCGEGQLGRLQEPGGA